MLLLARCVWLVVAAAFAAVDEAGCCDELLSQLLDGCIEALPELREVGAVELDDLPHVLERAQHLPPACDVELLVASEVELRDDGDNSIACDPRDAECR
eukprot:100598-Prymnesium_polylepis.1